MTPPDGFLDAVDFRGYYQPSTGAEIRIQEIPISCDQLADGFTEERLLQRGLVVLERRELSGRGEPRLLLGANQFVDGQAFDQWIALVGDHYESAVATATCRHELSDPLLARLYDSLVTLEHRPCERDSTGLTVDTESDELTLARRFDSTMIFTRGGRFPVPNRGEPLAVLDVVVPPAGFHRLDDFARFRIANVAETHMLGVDSARPVVVEGRQGLELIASSQDLATGLPLKVYLLTLVFGRKFCVMLGVAPAELQQRYLPQFRRIGESISFLPSIVGSGKAFVSTDSLMTD